MAWPSARVRDTFLQYFMRHRSLPHKFVPSALVKPRNDPTLAFTNAGMNQFKEIILGYGRPPHPQVVNSQKCLRISDLHLVGTDTYHQTFFEMLGNWSFSSYFKYEACVMAWDLLTNVYKLDPDRLYVTYFGGGDSIPVDLETKEIWEKIGVPRSRILSFGKENFWTMGPIGPCGPSTEIHYDHRGAVNDPSEINKDTGIVVELWNVVFMQYNRNANGKLERLPLSHVVDTGAGLERLTAVLNQEVSNYNTDLFYPIFTKIQEVTGITPYTSSFKSDLDLCYRIFADHMRATTVALSDGVLPQTNQKIRRLIQRSLSITHTRFMPNVKSSVEIVDFLQEIVDTISSTLSTVYPEIEKGKQETMSILAFEVLRYLNILETIVQAKSKDGTNELIPPLLVADFPNLQKVPKAEIERVKNCGIIDGKTSFAWYERHGVTQEAMEEFSATLGLQYSAQEFKLEFDRVKKKFRDEYTKQVIVNEEILFGRKVESLLALYNPKVCGGAHISVVDISKEDPVWIEWIFDEDGDPVEEICKDAHSYWIVLNKTPFAPGDNFIESDVGTIVLENNCKLNVTKVKRLPSGWLLHQVNNVPEIGFSRRVTVSKIDIDNEKKYGREMSMEAMVYLKKWLKKKFGVVRFAKEFVFDKEIVIEFVALHGYVGDRVAKDLTAEDIEECQNYLNEQALPVVITNRVLKKNGEFTLTCATGLAAEVALRCGWEVRKSIAEMKILMNKCKIDHVLEVHKQNLEEVAEDLRFCLTDANVKLPYEITLLIKASLVEIQRFFKRYEKTNKKLNKLTETK